MTVHQAKGLEWPVVFLFSMVEGRFPSMKMGEVNWMDVPRIIKLDDGAVDFDAARYEGNLEDERRLFYVAATRAKDALILSYFARVMVQHDKSPFLEELPATLYEAIDPGDKFPLIHIDPAVQTEEMVTFEAGEILRYDRCPYMYLLGNVWGYQPEFSEALGYGKGVHFCIVKAVENLKKGMGIETAVREAMREFFVPYAPPYLREAMEKSARKSLAILAERTEEDLRRSAEMEYRIEYPSKKATIAGKVDAIIRGEDAYEVRDYKTSLEVTTETEARYQVGLYSAGLRKLGRKVEGGSVVVLKEGDAEIRRFPIDDAMLDGTEARAAETIRGIMEKRFKATPGESCGKCDQTKICKWCACKQS
jgi:DNA helicase-2/ATP-dependent DNA helicase PcrA